MKVLVLYRPNSEHSRLVEEFIHDYQHTHETDKVEPISIDTREGSATASLYDITMYPAIVVIRNDGYVQKLWEGENFPMMDEVAAYTRG